MYPIHRGTPRNEVLGAVLESMAVWVRLKSASPNPLPFLNVIVCGEPALDMVYKGGFTLRKTPTDQPDSYTTNIPIPRVRVQDTESPHTHQINPDHICTAAFASH